MPFSRSSSLICHFNDEFQCSSEDRIAITWALLRIGNCRYISESAADRENGGFQKGYKFDFWFLQGRPNTLHGFLMKITQKANKMAFWLPVLSSGGYMYTRVFSRRSSHEG